MKITIGVEVVIIFIIVYFLLGDPFSLATFSSTFVGKIVSLILLIYLTSNNIIYGLIFLMILLHLDENRIMGLEIMSNNTDIELASSAINESLKDKVFKCKDGVSTIDNWEQYIKEDSPKGSKKCDPCSKGCKWEFKCIDHNGQISKECELRPKQSYPVLNDENTDNVVGISNSNVTLHAVNS